MHDQIRPRLAAFYNGKLVMSGAPDQVRKLARMCATGEAVGNLYNYKSLVIKPAVFCETRPSIEAVRDTIEDRKHEIARAIEQYEPAPTETQSKISKQFPMNCPEDNIALRQLLGWSKLTLRGVSIAVEQWQRAGKSIEWDELADAVRCVEGGATPQTWVGMLFQPILLEFGSKTAPSGESSCN